MSRLGAVEARILSGSGNQSDIEVDFPLLLIGERRHRLYPINPIDIEYIEAAGNYVKYFRAGREYIARELLKELEGRLRHFGFLRIERSLLLNVWAVEYVEPVGHGTFAFTLQSGPCLHSGKNYRAPILKVLPLRRRSANRSVPAFRVGETGAQHLRAPAVMDSTPRGQRASSPQGRVRSSQALHKVQSLQPKVEEC